MDLLAEQMLELEREWDKLTENMPNCQVCKGYGNMEKISEQDIARLNKDRIGDDYLMLAEGDFYCGCEDL